MLLRYSHVSCAEAQPSHLIKYCLRVPLCLDSTMWSTSYTLPSLICSTWAGALLGCVGSASRV